MKTFFSQTREGFRLILAWVAGFLSFGLLSGLSDKVSRSEAELAMLLALIGAGILGLAGALIVEGLAVRHK